MSGHPIEAAADTFSLSAQQTHLLSREQKIGHLLVGAMVLDLPAGCDVEDVRRALVELCVRHEILRTEYVSIEGVKLPLQSIRPAPEFTLPEAALNVIDRDADPVDLLAEARSRLGAVDAPPLSASILRTAGSSRRLFLAAPLRSLDAASMAVLARDLRALLAGEAACPQDETLQYADYAAWQNELLESALGEQGRAFWRGLLDTHAASSPPLPFERDRATQGNVVRTGAWNDALPAKLAAAAHTLGASEDHLLFFSWTAFIARLSGAQQLLGGFAIDGRSDEVGETVGPFARMLPVAADLDPAKSLRANWQRFADRLEASQSWKDYLDERDFVDGDGQLRLGHTFGYDTAAASNCQILQDDAATDRLHLEYRKEGGRAYLTLSYIEGRFPPGMSAIWLDQFATFLARALDELDSPIDEIGTLGIAERRRVLRDFNTVAAPPTAYHDSLLHRLFEEQADVAPKRVAVQIGDVNLACGELERRANRVANTLQEHGLQPDHIVGIYAGRAIETVVAILGVLKAGGAYLPLDPGYPVARLAFMLADAKATHLLTLDPLAADITLDEAVTVHSLAADSPLWHAPDDRPAHAATDANLAYVIYTSGSTGQPKGVTISHANAVASTRARFAFYPEPVRAFLLLSSFSFDSSVAGLFWTLGQGGRLCLPEGEDHRDPARLAALIERADISHFLALPSLHAQILGQLGDHRLACAIVAGEACPSELPRTHAARLPGVALVNEYGPTEGSVWCTGWRADLEPDDESVALGRPIPGARIHILDAALEPAPIGVEGEIYVAGAGVARGYLQRPALTAERFVPDPYGVAAGDRLYRTGDLGRYRPDGVIEYRGRIDQQVKIRGFRIELGEIEAALRRCDGIDDAAVIARTTPAGQELVGFVIAGGPQAGQPSLDDLHATLADALPSYMLPARLRRLEQLPHTPNGKLDRHALEALDASRREYIAPRNELERVIADVWADALAVERVGVHDNFFELGGHSLLATRLRSRLQAELNVALPLRFFFEGETLEQFAAKIAAHRAGELDDAKVDALETLFAEAEAR